MEMRNIRKILKVFLLIWLVFGTYGLSHADDINRAKLLLEYKYKLDTPIKFFIQHHEPKSLFSSFRDVKEESPSFISRAKGKGCKVDEEFEIRFIAIPHLACGKVIPIEGQEIQYNAIDDVEIMNALMIDANKKKWRQVDVLQEADLAILVELELTNLVSFNNRVNKIYNTATTDISAPKYEPRYVLGMTVSGVNSDSTVKDRIVFTARVNNITFQDYPSEETLSSLMIAVGEKIRKQKNFGYKGAQILRFTNFEDSGK